MLLKNASKLSCLARRLWAASALFCLASAALAQLPPLGTETAIHTTTVFNEHEVSCGMDAWGNFVTAYSHTDSASNNGIAIRRFNRKGQTVGSLVVPHDPAGIQQQPSVAVGDDGRYVVVWEDNRLRGSSNHDIFFALYNTAGTLIAGPVQVNTLITGTRENPRVAMNRSTGEFVVVFAGGPNSNLVDAYYRRYSSTGSPLDATEKKANTSTNTQDYAPSVAFSNNGTFIVAWEGNPNNDLNFEAYFQRFTFAGSSATPLGANIVASETGHDTTEVEVACDDAGSFVLAWVDGLPAHSNDPKNLLFRRYDGGGFAVTPVTIFKGGAFAGNGDLLVPRIRTVMENDDDFAFTYLHNDEIYLRFFTGAGTAKGGEIHVNSTTNADAGEFQSKPWLAINPTGNRAVVAWNGTGTADSNAALFQRYAEPNQAPVLTAIGAKSGPELSALTFTASASETAANFGDTITYSLAAGAPTGASINPTTGAFTWTPTEAQGPGIYPITIVATDDGEPQLSDSETITITVSEVNQNPLTLVISHSHVQENVPAGTVVGTLLTTDNDLPAQTFTFSLVPGPGSTDNASFSIDGDKLKIMVSPDFESKASYGIRLQVQDSAGGTFQSAYVITIQDVLESSVSNWTLY